MSREVSQTQKRRAENIIWNSAGAYGFVPDFRAFDSNGNAELYWNCIIGAARKHYEYETLAQIFQAFDQYEDAAVYNGLLWLGLENALYYKELSNRPALQGLREQYARELIAQLGVVDDSRFYDFFALAHFKRAIGESFELGRYDRGLLDALEFTPDMSADDISACAKELFERWFQISTELKPKRSGFAGLLAKKKSQKQDKENDRFGRGFTLHSKKLYSGGESAENAELNGINSKLTLEQLREFMEFKYGRQIFTQHKLLEIERSICVGNHSGCNLLFTRGELPDGNINNAFEALQKQKEARQIERNRSTFYDNYATNMTAVSALAAKIRNSVLLYLHPAYVKSDSGLLDAPNAWRAPILNDERIFIKNENSTQGNISVDILLDASTSQKNRQEAVSNQGYMITESLCRCAIPCRVISFCSMTGFTILKILKDYNEQHATDRIFEYVSNGCNRDGLAIKAAHYLMNETPYEHKLLIVLSDVKPNDVRKICDRDGNELSNYELNAGLTDTALEVRRARADGIAVVCVFTGTDDDLPSAKLVYGNDFARIQSLDKFAETVGTLIQNQIKII